jgi:hypothetical protein
MSESLFLCQNPKCGKQCSRRNAEINRSAVLGRKQYCSRRCYAIAEGINNLANTDPATVKLNQERIKSFAGKARKTDKYSPFRWFLRVINNANRIKHSGLLNPVTIEFLHDLWVSQNGICPYTGLTMILPSPHGWTSKTNRASRASLDRIDNRKGYEMGNVRFVSFMANIAKNNMSDQDLIDFCHAVALNHPQKSAKNA